MNKKVDLNQIINLTIDDATQKLKTLGYISRVVEQDGKHFAVTCDYRTDRINLSVSAGKVFKAEFD